MALLRTLIFTFLVPGSVTILVPYWLLTSRPDGPPPIKLGILRFFGALPILIGAAIYCWCAWDFTFAGRGTPAPLDPPKKLVVRGLYRYVKTRCTSEFSQYFLGRHSFSLHRGCLNIQPLRSFAFS